MQTLRRCFAEKVMLKQTTIFNISFHLRTNFKMSFGKSLILPAALSAKLLLGVLVFSVLRTLPFSLSLSLSCTVVAGVVFGPVLLSWVGVVFGSLYLYIYCDGTTSWSKQVYSVLEDAAVLTYTCRRPSVVARHNQWYSEMKRVFFTTRMLRVVLQDSGQRGLVGTFEETCRRGDHWGMSHCAVRSRADRRIHVG